jgi:hypothetical protein
MGRTNAVSDEDIVRIDASAMRGWSRAAPALPLRPRFSGQALSKITPCDEQTWGPPGGAPPHGQAAEPITAR